MRWLLLLFMPCIAAASSLTGSWSVPLDEEFPGYTRAVIIDMSDRLYFHFEKDHRHRCEAFGIARRKADNLFVFRNQPEDWFFTGYEGYGTDQNRDCEITFELVEQTLKVRSTQSCRSFCGVAASISGDLHKVPSDLPPVTPPQSVTPPQ